MKQTSYIKFTIYFVIIFCVSCAPIDNKNRKNTIETSIENKNNSLKETTYFHLNKLSIIGDFDGDGKKDTLYQNTVNQINQSSIDSFADNQWDSIENYFYKINADVILTIANRHFDTLHLGAGGGLYCLINMGDNNKDNKDEIALVVDDYSFTNISSCYIYTLCGHKWIALKSFKIHESAFDYRGDSAIIFKQINGFLEQRKNKWFYIDYQDWFNAENDKDAMLKPLKLKKGC